MAQLTHVRPEYAEQLRDEFNLPIVAMEVVARGSVNSNYALRLSDGRSLFMRVYEEQGFDQAQDEAGLLAHLASHGVKTPRPLSRADDAQAFLSRYEDKPVALFPWVAGEMRCQSSVSTIDVAALGRSLALVHRYGDGYPWKKDSRFGPAELLMRLDTLAHLGAAVPREIRELLPRLRDQLAAIASLPRSADTAAVIHGDLFRDNVLFDAHGIAALLDFESASRGQIAFDFAVTFLAWCFGDKLDATLARAFAKGYEEVRPLEPDERADLFAETRLAALRFTLTRVTDFELRPRGVGVYKNFRRFLMRLDQVESLGQTGLLSLFGLNRA